MKKLLPLITAVLLFTVETQSQAVDPFTTCPEVNVAVVRSGMNADIQNPYYIYTVNTTNGTFTQLPGGPLRNPENPVQNLQVNGIGVNTIDGYMYGLASEGSVNTARFVRFDKRYGVTLFGNIAPPTSLTGPLSFINFAAGDVDRNNNYYFTAFTASSNGPNSLILDKLFIGKIQNISTLAPGVTPAVTYYEIDISDANCTDYVNSLNSDANNSGIKDISFSPSGNTIYSYVTYPSSPGSATFNGQLVQFVQVSESNPLKYKLVCNTNVNSHSAETAGTLIDNAGKLEILLTDGTVGTMQSSGSPFTYSGIYIPLNNATGFTYPIRADMGSCGAASGGPLPVTLSAFAVRIKDCKANFSWRSENEINFNRYELQQSFDASNFVTVGTVTANRNTSAINYNHNIPAAGKQAFYRLKLIDNDGRFTYSGIVSVNNFCTNMATGFSINPNPVYTNLNLNWYGVKGKPQITISVYDAYGSVVKLLTQYLPEGNSVVNINLDRLAPGIYFIKAVDPKNDHRIVQRFVKH